MDTGVGTERAGLGRIVAKLADAEIVRKLASDLTAADLTTLLLTVVQERATRVRGPEALARYLSDRFSRPGTVPFERLREVEDLLIGAVPGSWEWIVASPLAPFGVHAALGPVSQDWVVSTVRADEVAADPTIAIALEAAARRRDSATRRTDEPQRLATIQRIIRGQRYRSPLAFTHFSIFALVSAGRSRPDFDERSIHEHLGIYVAALSQVAASIEIVLSTREGPSGRRLLEGVRERWHDSVRVTEDAQRLPAQRYYRRACFKVNATIGTEALEIADGGFTDWTERLLGDRRERLLISGAGLDRPALALEARSSSQGQS